jgi:hypothetical protein
MLKQKSFPFLLKDFLNIISGGGMSLIVVVFVVVVVPIVVIVVDVVGNVHNSVY